MKEIDCTILEKMYEEKTKYYKDRIYEVDDIKWICKLFNPPEYILSLLIYMIRYI